MIWETNGTIIFFCEDNLTLLELHDYFLDYFEALKFPISLFNGKSEEGRLHYIFGGEGENPIWNILIPFCFIPNSHKRLQKNEFAIDMEYGQENTGGVYQHIICRIKHIAGDYVAKIDFEAKNV